MQKIIYGNMPIHRAKFGNRHPHLVVIHNDKEFISVGLTTSNKRNDLRKVYYSNGKQAYLKRNAERKKRSLYEKKRERFNVDIETENHAYKIAMNKLLNDFENKRK